MIDVIGEDAQAVIRMTDLDVAAGRITRTYQLARAPGFNPLGALTPILPNTAMAVDLASTIHGTADLAKAMSPMTISARLAAFAEAAKGATAAAAARGKTMALGVLSFVAKAVTVYGATNEAIRSYKANSYDGQAKFGAATITFVACMFAGLIDDAITVFSGGVAIGVEMESYEHSGSGAAQHAAGDAVRWLDLPWRGLISNPLPRF
jgi:hypothetical protein